MTFQEIASMIAEVGIPYAYYVFPESTPQAPPFICFLYPNNDDLMADNINYSRITALTIELYTEEKDFSLEATLENILKNHGLKYLKSETYLDSEKMNMEVYETEVLING